MRNPHEVFLRGKPYALEKIQISLPTLEEIYDMSLDLYLEYLYAIIMDFDSLRGKITLDQDGYISDFQILLLLLISDQDYANRFLEGLYLFTKDRYVFAESSIASIRRKTPKGLLPLSEALDEEGELVLFDILTEEKWKKIREILCLAHWTKCPEERGPLKGKAAEIAEKLRRNKEEVSRLKAKQSKKDNTEVFELVASLAAYPGSSYNLFNVWKLNYYQFFDQFKRLQLNEEYHFSLDQILAGVDPKKLEIHHWSSSILNQN